MSNEEYIFTQSVKYTQNDDQYYTASGFEDYLDEENNPKVTNQDSEKILAKKIYKEHYVKYYIKLSNRLKLYDPYSIYDDEKQSSFLDRICRNSGNKFKEVNEKTFNFYLLYLKTKNKSWITNAEREVE